MLPWRDRRGQLGAQVEFKGGLVGGGSLWAGGGLLPTTRLSFYPPTPPPMMMCGFLFLGCNLHGSAVGLPWSRSNVGPMTPFLHRLKDFQGGENLLNASPGDSGLSMMLTPKDWVRQLGKNDDACNATWVCGREREGLGGREEAGGCHWVLRAIQETPENLLGSHPHSNPAGYLLIFSSRRRGNWGFVWC